MSFRLLAACLLFFALRARAVPTYKAERSLVSWKAGLENLEKFRFPFATKYDDGRKRLVYVAGNHTTGINSANLKTVKAMFDELAPQAVLVEGFRTKRDFSYKTFDPDSFARDEFRSTAEAPYALYLANKAGLAVRGGEPFDKELLDTLTRAGYSADDVIGFLVVRMIPSWREDGVIPDDAAFKRKVVMYLQMEKQNLHIKQFGFDELLAWYSRQGSPELPIRAIEYEHLRPYAGEDSTKMQKISFAIDQVREDRFLSQLESLVNRFDRVLVVYGGSHLCRERPMLEKMFGKSNDVKPF